MPKSLEPRTDVVQNPKPAVVPTENNKWAWLVRQLENALKQVITQSPPAAAVMAREQAVTATAAKEKAISDAAVVTTTRVLDN